MVQQEFILEEKTINEYLNDNKLSLGDLKFEHYVEMAQRESDLKSFFSETVENKNSRIYKIEVPPGSSPSPLGSIVETITASRTPSGKNTMMTTTQRHTTNAASKNAPMNTMWTGGNHSRMMVSSTPTTSSTIMGRIPTNPSAVSFPKSATQTPIREPMIQPRPLRNPPLVQMPSVSGRPIPTIMTTNTRPIMPSPMPTTHQMAIPYRYRNEFMINRNPEISSMRPPKRKIMVGSSDGEPSYDFDPRPVMMPPRSQALTTYTVSDSPLRYPSDLRSTPSSAHKGVGVPGTTVYLPHRDRHFVGPTSSAPPRPLQSGQMGYSAYDSIRTIPIQSSPMYPMRPSSMNNPSDFPMQPSPVPRPRPLANVAKYGDTTIIPGASMLPPLTPSYTGIGGRPLVPKSPEYNHEKALFHQQYLKRRPTALTSRRLGPLSFDLFDLFMLVQVRGGYNVVQNQGLWREIYTELGGDWERIKLLPKLVKLYEDALLDMELNRPTTTPMSLESSPNVPRPAGDKRRGLETTAPTPTTTVTRDVQKNRSPEQPLPTKPKFEAVRLETIGGIDLHAIRNLVDIRQKTILDPSGFPAFIPSSPISFSLTINALNLLCAKENISLNRYPTILAEISEGFLNLCRRIDAINSEEDSLDIFVDPSERPILLEQAIILANILRSLSFVVENQQIMATDGQLVAALVKALSLHLENERKEDIINHAWVVLSNIAYFVELACLDNQDTLTSILVKTVSSEQTNRRMMALECLSKMTSSPANQNLVASMDMRYLEDLTNSVIEILTRPKRIEVEFSFALIIACNLLDTGDLRVIDVPGTRLSLLNRLKSFASQSPNMDLKPSLQERIHTTLSKLAGNSTIFPFGEIETDFNRLFQDDSMGSFLVRSLN
jgi:hypothetical protein